MSIIKMKKKCDVCGGNFFPYKARKDDLPSGTTFILESGDIINVCTDCIITERFEDVIKLIKDLDKKEGDD